MTAQAYAELSSDWNGPGDPPQAPVQDMSSVRRERNHRSS
jgi:hypothetical protein